MHSCMQQQIAILAQFIFSKRLKCHPSKPQGSAAKRIASAWRTRDAQAEGAGPQGGGMASETARAMMPVKQYLRRTAPALKGQPPLPVQYPWLLLRPLQAQADPARPPLSMQHPWLPPPLPLQSPRLLVHWQEGLHTTTPQAQANPAFTPPLPMQCPWLHAPALKGQRPPLSV